jgi:predicted transcriptional regulator
LDPASPTGNVEADEVLCEGGCGGMLDEVRHSRAELERQVMTALAVGGQPMTLEQVRERLGGKVMCTTVMTVLGRLHDKGLTRREQVGRSFVYTALGTQAQLTASRMRHLLDTGGEDPAPVLAWFVGMLTPDEERLLSNLVKDR